MARPNSGYTSKPSQERKTGPDKMRMSHDRMRRDIKRIEQEQAKAAALAAEVVRPKRGK